MFKNKKVSFLSSMFSRYLLLRTKTSQGTTVSWLDTTKWVSLHRFNFNVLNCTFTQHNEVKTFKRPVISLMLLARAVSYRAWAQYSTSTHSLTHPKALPLLMCYCSGRNKTRIWNALQKLIRYLAWFKEQQVKKNNSISSLAVSLRLTLNWYPLFLASEGEKRQIWNDRLSHYYCVLWRVSVLLRYFRRMTRKEYQTLLSFGIIGLWLWQNK